MWIISFLKNLFSQKSQSNVPDNPGALPSPSDIRDITLSAVQAPIELRQLPEYFMTPYPLKILNQGSSPACVGFSCAVLKAEKERREQNSVDFDGLWIYNKAKEVDGYAGKGTYLRTGMKILKDAGALPSGMSPVLEAEAMKYKIGAYAKVDDISFEGLKAAIYQNGIILAGFYGDKPGWTSAYLKPPKTVAFGHAIALIGWNKDYLVFQNSWGETWGEKGIGYIPKDYLPFEAWAILVDLPLDFIREERPKHTFNNDMGLNDKNDEVLWLQKCLKYLGHFPKIVEPTGFYGQITVGAVVQFQKAYGISQTGFAGTNTRTKLNELFA